MRIDIVLFDGFDELDGLAPLEVLQTARGHGADIEATLVGAYGAATIAADHGARLVVDRGISEDADVVLVPGGGWFTRGDHGAWVEVQRGTCRRRSPLLMPVAPSSPPCARARW